MKYFNQENKMGSQYIEGFKEMGTDLDTMLRIQLQNNHYPPVSLAFIPACKEAIAHCKYGVDDYDHIIQLPNGRKMTALQIVEGLHLNTFCARDKEDEDALSTM